MGRRLGAFLAASFGGTIELFGGLYGQGVLGHGMLFGLLGEGTRGEAAILGFAAASATIVAAVALMFVRETRWLAALIAILAIVGTMVAGQVFGYGASLALIGAIIAWRVDRAAALV